MMLKQNLWVTKRKKGKKYSLRNKRIRMGHAVVSDKTETITIDL